jgi:hypothetical protein
MRTFSCLLSLGLLLLAPSTLRADNPVIVHEWGTFTSLQDENGRAIGGINVDDEPVPGFVFRDGCQPVVPQFSNDNGNFGLPPFSEGKGWASGDPAVTMRLETPVLYIYPPKGETPQSVPPLDVHVDFHGGFLTQFYPYAHAVPFNGIGEITGTSISSLDWAGVQLGSTEKPVETNDKVWTTPREVSAPLIQVMMHFEGGDEKPDPVGVLQAEHFLFYRGVGHLDSPIRVLDQKDKLEIGPTDKDIGTLNYCWLVEIHPDGTCAFRYPPFILNRTIELPKITSSFSEADFKPDNLTKLKASMQAALIKEGLYPDEASAMLRTWELSYFKSPGLRFFYIVPRAWVDKVLPLKITGAPTDITRVMIGRIELINDEQKAALARLATGPCPDLAAVKQAAFDALEKGNLTDAQKEPFYSGEKPLSDLGIAIPPLVHDYLSLGRFRDALIVHEQQQHASPALAQFIKDNSLAQAREYTTIPAVDPTASR